MRNIRSKQNFSAGEISPRLYSRSDTTNYTNGLQTCINAIPLVQGPVRKRNGTQFISESKDSTKACRLIKFQFSADDAFILEFGEFYIRFYTGKAQVESGGSPYEVTTSYSATEVQAIQYVQFGSEMYLVHPDHQPKVLTRIGSSNWTISDYSPSPPVTSELGHIPPSTITPGATAGIGITFTTAAGVFLAADSGRQIINTSGTGIASITGYTSSTQVTVDIIEDFPSTAAIASGDWKLDLSPVSMLTPSEISAGSIITLTSHNVAAPLSVIDTFASDDIGSYIAIHGGIVEVTQVTSPSVMKGLVLKSLSSTDQTESWSMEVPAWSNTRGYPRAVGFFEQRLIFGGTTAEPQSIWMSDTGNYTSFGTGPNDADAIDVDIVSSEVNRIEWIASGRDLIIGTSGAETTITGGQGSITPSTIQLRPRTYLGSNGQQVITSGSEVMFITKSSKKIRTFVYKFDIDGYTTEDLLFVAEHLTASDGDSIKEMTFTHEPESRIHAILDSGDLLIGVFDREQQVIGWSTATTDGNYEQIETITETGEDQVWVVVNRTIGGVAKRYIEVFDKGEGTGSIDGFSDSFLTYEGVATTTFTGLAHLEGETVQIKVNGATHPDGVVSGGSVTLNVSATTATVGLPYTTTIETLDDDFNVGRGSMLGQRVSWVEPILKVYQSSWPTVNGQIRPQRTPEMEMDQSVDLYSGYLVYSRTDSPRVLISHTAPLPLLVSGIFGLVEGGV